MSEPKPTWPLKSRVKMEAKGRVLRGYTGEYRTDGKIVVNGRLVPRIGSFKYRCRKCKQIAHFPNRRVAEDKGWSISSMTMLGIGNPRIWCKCPDCNIQTKRKVKR